MKYEKLYTKEGIPFYFKIDDPCFQNKRLIIKFMAPNDDGWNYHYPDKKFRNVIHLIKFLQKNVETKNLKVSIKV